jgi:arabinofuranosyltransferase
MLAMSILRKNPAGEEARTSLWSVQSLLLIVALLFFLLVMLRIAWVCDDAYITFRTVRNFIAGNGMRWNSCERVQSFTHPLWFLLMSALALLLRDFYASTLLISVLLSLATVTLVALRATRRKTLGLLGVALLVSSKSFVDFSTSGLENALSHFLFVLFLLELVGRWPLRRWTGADSTSPDVFRLAFLSGLMTLNRPDTFLLALPALAMVLRPAWKSWRTWWLVTKAFAPLLLWELVALVYFGFPFPNTAYAKLGMGIPAFSMMRQGLAYFVSELVFDPLAMVILALAMVAPLLAHERRLRPVSVGFLLYALYLVRIGGDFMAGRFFSLLVVGGVFVILCCAPVVLRQKEWLAGLAALAVLGLGLLITPKPVLTAAFMADGKGEQNFDARGIADERLWYLKESSLVWRDRGSALGGWFTEQGKALPPGKASLHMNLGFFGFAAPADAIIVDYWGLTDPLLARLPAENPKDWRIGHVGRPVPKGYLETLETGKNQFEDKRLGEFYQHLSVITRGPLFSWERLKTIWRFNLGSYDYLAKPAT